MCGVIGFRPLGESRYEEERTILFGRLMEHSKIRGLHSFGIAQVAFGEMLLHRDHRLEEVVKLFEPGLPTVAHCRYSTSGDWRDLDNCQPLVCGNLALAFNGVIHMGTKEEMEQEFDVSLSCDNDGEVFLRRVLSGQSPFDFLPELSGSFAGVWLDARDMRLRAIRNERRPLWRAEAYDAVWYASTRDIFTRAGVTFCVEVRPYSLEIS